jgi:hypothetical protein
MKPAAGRPSPADRLYGALLVVYPAGFRREYGPLMTQVFRDCRRAARGRAGVVGLPALWATVLLDLATTGLRERLAARRAVAALTEGSLAMNGRHTPAPIWAYPLALAAGLFLAYGDLHTDDTGLIAIPILGVCALLGFLGPRWAWRWALLVGLPIPLAEWLVTITATKPITPPMDLSGALIGSLLFGLAGAYGGSLLRTLLRHAGDSAPSPRS